MCIYTFFEHGHKSVTIRPYMPVNTPHIRAFIKFTQQESTWNTYVSSGARDFL